MKTKGELTVNTNRENKVRLTLRTLQPSATDKENLVGGGRSLRSVGQKHDFIKRDPVLSSNEQIKPIYIPEISPIQSEASHVESSEESSDEYEAKEEGKDIALQVSPADFETDPNDLIVEEPSEHYWEVISEKRRMSILNVLEENQLVKQENAKLRKQMKIIKEMLDEARNTIGMLQDMVENDGESDNLLNSIEDFP